MNTSTATLNPTLAQPRADQAPGFYQRLVMQALAPMTLGCLHLELPDGAKKVFGQPGAKISASVRILRPEFFKRCVLYGDIGFGEAYVDGDWDTDDITQVISWFILNVENASAMSGSRGKKILLNLLGWKNRFLHRLRPNSLKTSRRNISEHYDLGNDFYKLFLDPTMTYSSALFDSFTETLEAAQTVKYDRLCRQLKLKPGEHVLEIGSGWGGFSQHAAKNYGVRITTVTISEAQFKYARDLFQNERLADRVEIKLMDYRLLTGHFDKIVSIEMLEAVGDAYYETYFAKCHELLNRGRTHAHDIETGDALDFWRVLVADKQARGLLLFAEMRLPGEAWLEFKIMSATDGDQLVQTATFRPRGVLGRLYWYAVLPLHGFIFNGMINNIIKAD